MITVNHFGLHWIEGDIGLLVQQNRVDTILPFGPKFEVTTLVPRRGLVCPHQIDLEAAKEASLPDDKLVNGFLPIPKDFGEKAIFLKETTHHLALVQELLRLSGGGNTHPLWSLRPEVAHDMLHLTNLQPLVIYGCDTSLQVALFRIIQASFMAPRRLVVLGPAWTVLREEIERYETNLTQLPANLEQAGAWVLRQHMLRKP